MRKKFVSVENLTFNFMLRIFLWALILFIPINLAIATIGGVVLFFTYSVIAIAIMALIVSIASNYLIIYIAIVKTFHKMTTNRLSRAKFITNVVIIYALFAFINTLIDYYSNDNIIGKNTWYMLVNFILGFGSCLLTMPIVKKKFDANASD